MSSWHEHSVKSCMHMQWSLFQEHDMLINVAVPSPTASARSKAVSPAHRYMWQTTRLLIGFSLMKQKICDPSPMTLKRSTDEGYEYKFTEVEIEGSVL